MSITEENRLRGKISICFAKSGKYFSTFFTSDCQCSLISSFICALRIAASNSESFSNIAKLS